MLYFIDLETSDSSETAEELMNAKISVRSYASLVNGLPLILCVFLENKIAAHYDFGAFHKLQAHGLTAMLFAGFIV